MDILFIPLISFITVYLITPSVRYAALKFDIVDKADHRKIHKKLVTKIGGLAIYIGFLAGMFTVSLFDAHFFKENYSSLSGFIMCSSLMLILGVYDDIQGSTALLKLITQTIIALLAVRMGIVLEGIFIPGIINIHFGMFSKAITVFWLVSITNALNLIDGMDGLAAGITGIAASFIFVCGLLLKDNMVVFISLALAGACFAFLRYNFHPAKIFMGDTGSLFLGLSLASLGAYSPKVGNISNPYLIPVALLLILPIFDTFFAIIRRIINLQHIFKGDSSHIHHYCLKKGFTQVQTAIGFYYITFFMGLISLAILWLCRTV